MNPDVSKAIHYYKVIFKMSHIINSKRLETTIWADSESTSSTEPMIITKAEIRKRARIIRKRIKKKLAKIEQKYSPQFKIKVKQIAQTELKKGF